MEGVWKRTNHRETKPFPETDGPLVGTHDQIELHSPKAHRHCDHLRMSDIAEAIPWPSSGATHVAAVANVSSETRLIGFDVIGSHYAPAFPARNIRGGWHLDPGAMNLYFCALWRKWIGVPGRESALEEGPDCLPVRLNVRANSRHEMQSDSATAALGTPVTRRPRHTSRRAPAVHIETRSGCDLTHRTYDGVVAQMGDGANSSRERPGG
jgi:hypothetical protein